MNCLSGVLIKSSLALLTFPNFDDQVKSSLCSVKKNVPFSLEGQRKPPNPGPYFIMILYLFRADEA